MAERGETLLKIVCLQKPIVKMGFEERMLQVKKKTICFAVVSVLLLAGIIIYILPIPLSDCMRESRQITITLNEIGIQDGQPFINPITYPDITEEQKSSIFTLCSQYSYRRTFQTLFSDGSMSGLGNRLMLIYVNGDDLAGSFITISSTGEISIDNRTYKMDHAEQFIQQMTDILAQPA